MDRVLVDLMLEEMQRAGYSNANFKQHSWTKITKSFNASLGYNCTSTQVSDHFKSLKKKFSLYEELLRLSGWGWDPETRTPTPGYEGAWEEVIKVNKRFSMIRRKPFPLYDDMQQLCKNSISTGELADGITRATNKKRSSEGAPVIDVDNAIPPTLIMDDDEFLANYTSLGDSQQMMSVSIREPSQAVPTNGSPLTQTTPKSDDGDMAGTSGLKRNKGKGKKSDSKVGFSALQMFAEVSRERNKVLQQMFGNASGQQLFGNASGQQSNPAHQDLPAIPSIYDVLRDLKTNVFVPYSVYLKAMKLFTDPDMRLLWSAMPEEDRVNWLTMMTDGL